MSDTVVSVVIPAYNAGGCLGGTLRGVFAQTFGDYEVIVVDDGSSDGTGDLAEELLTGRAGRVIRQANKKIAAARNAGIAAARGEWVAFLDSDDLWFPEKLEVSLRELAAHPEADLACHAENIVEGSRLLQVRRYGPWVEPMYEHLLWKGCALSTSAVLVRRARLLEAGGFRENPEFNTVEDYDLWLRLAKLCRFHFIERVLGEYRYEARGASRRIAYHHRNLESLLLDHFRTLYGGSPTPFQRRRMRSRLSDVYRSALGLLSRYGGEAAEKREFAWRMLRADPLKPKNLVRFAQWAGSAVLP